MLLLAPGAALLWTRGRVARFALAAGIAVAAALQLPGVVVDYSKVSVDWARSASASEVRQRVWRLSSSPLLLDARAIGRVLPANVGYLTGRAPLPAVDTGESASREFGQQFSFSVDFWWAYLVYMRVIRARDGLIIAGVLLGTAVGAAALAWKAACEIERHGGGG
jgi:hypothetical protein